MNLNSIIYVAGHAGLLGSAIVRRLRLQGYNNIFTATRAELELTNQSAVNDWFAKHKPEYVFLSAAHVPSIASKQVGDVILNNLQIQTNVINAAHQNGCKKLMFAGSSSAYPKIVQLPIAEEQLLSGYLDFVNESYAVSKIAGIMMCKHFEKQYGFNYVVPMLCNLYGPNDRFDLENAHVMAALINKFVTAKNHSAATITLWGDGTARREFLYADDAADGVIHCMLHGQGIINLAPDSDITLRELAQKIKQITGYAGDVQWDTTKPTGALSKKLDTNKINSLGWKPKESLDSGILQTIQWFESNQ